MSSTSWEYEKLDLIYIIIQQIYYEQMDVTQGQFLSEMQLVLNSEFSFTKTGLLTKAKEPVCPIIYPLLGKNRGIHVFPKQNKIQTASSQEFQRASILGHCLEKKVLCKKWNLFLESF